MTSFVESRVVEITALTLAPHTYQRQVHHPNLTHQLHRIQESDGSLENFSTTL